MKYFSVSKYGGRCPHEVWMIPDGESIPDYPPDAYVCHALEDWHTEKVVYSKSEYDTFQGTVEVDSYSRLVRVRGEHATRVGTRLAQWLEAWRAVNTPAEVEVVEADLVVCILYKSADGCELIYGFMWHASHTTDEHGDEDDYGLADGRYSYAPPKREGSR
jgi:hypothetical protein